MEIVRGRSYRVTVRYPWGGQTVAVTDAVFREADGTIRWVSDQDPGEGAYLDCVIQETATRVVGWYLGGCDVTVEITEE